MDSNSMSPEEKELLIRLDEKLSALDNNVGMRLDLLDVQLSSFMSNYTTKQEFWPVKTIVYGGAGIVLTSILGVLISGIAK